MTNSKPPQFRCATSSSAPGAAPLRQLTANVGVDGSIVIQDIRNGKATYGYNVATGQHVEMLKVDILSHPPLASSRTPPSSPAPSSSLSPLPTFPPSVGFLP